MKFQFKLQSYQTDAVDAVVQVFSGQRSQSPAPYFRDLGAPEKGADLDQTGIPAMPDDPSPAGYRNARLELSDGQLLENIRAVQAQNNIKLSSALVKELGRCSLDVEMETGTGKTYVYTKTMFELNKRYGWSKFIVVVPSIAIREGVKKSFEITEEHFMAVYRKKARVFIYNSKNLSQLDAFSSGSGINVMIINTQAFAASFNEDKNVEGRRGDQAARIIYSKRDEFASRRPIDVIRANRPIVILDEPQKMGGAVTQTALQKFDPLFTLNYSATHAKRHNLIYVLDALDAYNKRLVKKIEVKGIEVKNLRGADRYLYLENIVLSSQKPPMARLEFEVARRSGLKRETHLCAVHDSLYERSGEMEQYKGFTILDIDPVRRLVTFSNGERIAAGQVQGDISERDIRRIQIRETIASHFEKEEALFDLGVKTLSLFFIDEVARYRVYGKDGQEALGEYGEIFEQEYEALLRERLTGADTAYQRYLRRTCSDPHRVHRGYFSIDKKTGRSVNSALKRGMEFSDDSSAYDLIMRNKERLLSFEEPARFIFSHSALREGWDNPNVFQICTLKRSDSQTAKRQEVGRGLRLCVDQSGSRMDASVCGESVHDINQLTVVASESYAQFVSELQKDIRKDLCDRPAKASIDYFDGKSVRVAGQPAVLDQRQARIIYQYLSRNQYIDYDDNVTQTYRDAAAAGTLAPLPGELQGMEQAVHQLVQAVFDEGVLARMTEDGNAPKVKDNPLNSNFALFAPMWALLDHQYAYTVKALDSAALIAAAAAHINEKLFVTHLKYITTVGRQRERMEEHALERGESFAPACASTHIVRDAPAGQIPYDLVGKIAAGASLTRKTAAAILSAIHPEQFDGFRSNPEEFIAKVTGLIQEIRAEFVVAGLEYRQLDGTFGQTIFSRQRSAQSFEKAFPASRHIQDYVFTDGLAEKSVERTFAGALDGAKEVLVYAKLPRGYFIPTPMGRYTPDWAVVLHLEGMGEVFAVVETKGTLEDRQLRPIEQAKIQCAEKLFSQLDRVRFVHADSYQNLLDILTAANHSNSQKQR